MAHLHQISDIYEFIICPYRWYQKRALLIDYDNFYTIEGKISDTKKTNKTFRRNNQGEYEAYDVHVGDGSELYGICDTVIFYKNSQGVYIPQLSNLNDSKFAIIPMEYKQKEHHENLQRASHFQCVAQARCLEYMFNCQINTYYIYYKKEHRRKRYAITQLDREELQTVLNTMSNYLDNNRIPPRLFVEQSCPKCSMYEYCLPERCYSPTLSAYLLKEGE